jgi:hypothetical protein
LGEGLGDGLGGCVGECDGDGLGEWLTDAVGDGVGDGVDVAVLDSVGVDDGAALPPDERPSQPLMPTARARKTRITARVRSADAAVRLERD